MARLIDTIRQMQLGQLDEAKSKAPKLGTDSLKTMRSKDKAHADAMGRHVASGRKKRAENVDPTDTGGNEEISMAMRQLEAIEHFVEGIQDRLKETGDMEEWYQNKLTKAHDYLKTLYSYGKGDGDDDESMDEARKVECPQCEGEGCDHCDDKGYHMVKEAMDKVNPKALKKKFDDRKDKDIDNDGDVDDSDEYLHNRRKAVSKAISKDEEKEVEDDENVKRNKKKKENSSADPVEINPSVSEAIGDTIAIGLAAKGAKKVAKAVGGGIKKAVSPAARDAARAAEIRKKEQERKKREQDRETIRQERERQRKQRMSEEMTDDQMKRREEIVKGMKDREDEFKAKYGERYKDVMYATATKLAMKGK